MSNIFSNPEGSIRRYATYQLAVSLLVFAATIARTDDGVFAYYCTLVLSIMTLIGWLPLFIFGHGCQRQRDTIYSLGTVALMNVALMGSMIIGLHFEMSDMFMVIKAFLFIANLLSISVLFSYCFSRPSDYIRNAILWFNVTLLVLFVLSLFQ